MKLQGEKNDNRKCALCVIQARSTTKHAETLLGLVVLIMMIKFLLVAVHAQENPGCGQNKRWHWWPQEKETSHFFFFSVWIPIWFSYKTFFQVFATSRVMRMKCSALLALPCFTRDVQHLRGWQLGNAVVARKEVMEILSLGIQKTFRCGIATGLSPVRDSLEGN